MIYIGEEYKDKAGNTYLVKDVNKPDDFLYHHTWGGWYVHIECVEGKNKGIEKWIDYRFFESCIGDILEVVEGNRQISGRTRECPQ